MKGQWIFGLEKSLECSEVVNFYETLGDNAGRSADDRSLARDVSEATLRVP